MNPIFAKDSGELVNGESDIDDSDLGLLYACLAMIPQLLALMLGAIGRSIRGLVR